MQISEAMDPVVKPSSEKALHHLIQDIYEHLGVGQKITLGYSIIFGLATIGILGGQAVGGRWLETPAIKQQASAKKEVGTLIELKEVILESQSDIVPFLRNPDLLQTYYYHLLNRADQVQMLSERVQRMAVEQSDADRYNPALTDLAQAHDRAINIYWQELTAILAPFQGSSDTQSLPPLEAQALLIEFMNSPAAIGLEDFVDALDRAIDGAQRSEREAEITLAQARQLKAHITTISLLVSVVMAIALAAYLGRKLTEPLVAVTHVAQQTTVEANFDLRAPVTMKDEVGTLAIALNHLIQRVSELLAEKAIAQEQLEAYSHTLEQKVYERTQELDEKNVALQLVLDDLQRAHVQMVQSEKMSSLGQMVAGVAHEINNPVNFIHGNLMPAGEYIQDLLNLIQKYEDEYPIPTGTIQDEIEAIDLEFIRDDLPKLLESMQVGTGRIREIVISLRNFSRLDEAVLKAVDIHEGIDSTLMLLQNQIKERSDSFGINIVKKYGTLPLIECYPGQLNQVFMNLLANAIDALDEMRPKVSPFDNAPQNRNAFQKCNASQNCHTPQICIQTDVIDAQWISIRIQDNGMGISDTIKSRLFDPFFTTKPVGKGTGLGLAISHQVITETHHGTIECQSEPGQGSSFVIHLPIAQTRHLD